MAGWSEQIVNGYKDKSWKYNWIKKLIIVMINRIKLANGPKT